MEHWYLTGRTACVSAMNVLSNLYSESSVYYVSALPLPLNTCPVSASTWSGIIHLLARSSPVSLATCRRSDVHTYIHSCIYTYIHTCTCIQSNNDNWATNVTAPYHPIKKRLTFLQNGPKPALIDTIMLFKFHGSIEYYPK